MRPSVIAIKLDEHEHFLSAFIWSSYLRSKKGGGLPFQGLEELLRDGVVVRAALAGKDWMNPALRAFRKTCSRCVGCPCRC